MKAIKSILLILVGVIISCGCSVFAVSRYLANQVEYTSQKSLLAVNNVGDALDELYASTTFGNPTGTILAYMGNNAPSGYLKCDGTVYNISEYSNLANQIKTEFGSYNYFGGDGTTTFAVPDLRGEFLRGTGTNGHTNQGNGANVGVHQDGTSIATTTAVGNGIVVKNDDGIDGTASIQFYYNTTTTDTPPYKLFRPTNTSVLYVIKY